MHYYVDVIGLPTLLAFKRSSKLKEFRARLEELLVIPDAQVFALVRNESEFEKLADLETAHPTLKLGIDQDGEAEARLGMSGSAPQLYVTDPNSRLLADMPLNAKDLAHQVQALVGGSMTSLQTGFPPVLTIPRVLDPDWCQKLIDLWATDNRQSGHYANQGGTYVEVQDANVKVRRDHGISDPKIQQELIHILSRRVFPEVAKALANDLRYFEELKICRYDGESSGHFRPHRDNLSKAAAHRRFAMTLCLNEDYDGGQLRFPEYTHAPIKPRAGEAAVFSCSMLHEVLPVSAGERFVLLAFIFGEPEMQMIRQRGGTFKG
ncbi:putative 2-oxoglutarate/Fe(II)-dependent dioxygenase YbiX [Aestuariispira insulae]|uniref:Putative 2-oxoglutarate/Fe(II)-dependent dioxygenase YbiX n=2 Tax=Aestuariispira insulae TaxID=1461337 RepID=A0A3D9H9J0_9PROT|nr:putative 2-oxoglutarate/Fe(II)-dependent dioxygenase YbiX [Aestuariispira insulae]